MVVGRLSGKSVFRELKVGVCFDEFISNQYLKALYWGTEGQRITDQFYFDAFSIFQLIKYGKNAFRSREKKRNELALPSREELIKAVKNHLDTIRKYGTETDESFYSCGWLMDISRCIYTPRYNDIIGKTKAGEWALKENFFPIQRICPKLWQSETILCNSKMIAKLKNG